MSFSVTVNIPDATVGTYTTTATDGTTYDLLQFHIHWGADDTTGSEHTFEGGYYPAEVEFSLVTMLIVVVFSKLFPP